MRRPAARFLNTALISYSLDRNSISDSLNLSHNLVLKIFQQEKKKKKEASALAVFNGHPKSVNCPCRWIQPIYANKRELKANKRRTPPLTQGWGANKAITSIPCKPFIKLLAARRRPSFITDGTMQKKEVENEGTDAHRQQTVLRGFYFIYFFVNNSGTRVFLAALKTYKQKY